MFRFRFLARFIWRFVVRANNSRTTVPTAEMVTDLESGRSEKWFRYIRINNSVSFFLFYFNYIIVKLEVIFLKNPT